jgi:hypothetical protein
MIYPELTAEQIKNWRKILATEIGAKAAEQMSDVEIQYHHDKMQYSIDVYGKGIETDIR